MEDPQLGSATIDPQSERVDLKREKLRIGIQPLLSFESRSVDRGWTLFASPEDRMGPVRTLCSFGHREDAVRVEYAGVEPARIDVTRQPQVSTFVIKGWVELPQSVYSHLNSFGTVLIQGHERLELEFSPCLGQWIEPVPNDYPVGRPLRLGTMYQDGVFRVVEATSAEKGPFRTLAEGKLEPGHAVVITLRDAGKPLVSLCFDDWHTQISTELSPTAGWGMPQNEIMFARHTADPASVVFLGLTLASTSTGRGYDSVGHAAGVYRNRIRVKWLNGGEAATDR